MASKLMNQMLNRYLDQELSKMQGIGTVRAKQYQALGCNTYLDLINHFPFRYESRRNWDGKSMMVEGYSYILPFEPFEIKDTVTKKGRGMKVLGTSHGVTIEIIYFHKPFPNLVELFRRPKLIISGEVKRYNNIYSITHPEYIVIEGEQQKIPLIEPIYPLTHGLSSKMVHITVEKILARLDTFEETLDAKTIRHFNFLPKLELYKRIHSPSPSDLEVMEKLKERFAFEEYLDYYNRLVEFKTTLRSKPKEPLHFEGALKEEFVKKLPFELTAAQLRAIEDIETDQRASVQAFRLIQGDVGAGKTVVAIIAMLNAVECGYQAALIAPTEVLATQHYESICSYLQDFANVKVGFIAGSMRVSERKAVLAALEAGEYNVIVGTHALFQENVNFAFLGCVVIDEQHRFGVNQRKALVKKGIAVDCFMMSATPIPRTMQMALYSDLDLSIINQKPASRKDIITTTYPSAQYANLIPKIKERIAMSERVYWICPMIEESEAMDWVYVEERYESLKKQLGNVVGFLHGKMKPKEKDEVMQRFASGKISLLVATTVVEVGVDVKEATVIVIENAERFGLSQLHQLRGRVGRSSLQSYCILLYSNRLSNTAKQRLEVMKKSNDGFYIAEMDYKLRGAGDVIGTNQSGGVEFKFFNPELHKHFVEYIRDSYI